MDSSTPATAEVPTVQFSSTLQSLFRSGRLAIVLAVSGLINGAETWSLPVPALAAPPPARLYLKSGEFMDGRFAKSGASSALHWQSESFHDPVEVDWRWVRSVDFPVESDHDTSPSPFLFSFQDGSRVAGELLGLSEDELTIASEILGTLRLNRAQAVQMWRRDQGLRLIYEGPKSLDGWSSSAAPDSWKFEAGAIQTRVRNAIIKTEMRFPEKFCMELRWAWEAAPSFWLGIGMEALEMQPSASALRLEVADEQAVMTIESAKDSEIAVLKSLDDDRKQLELTIYVDQANGLVTAMQDGNVMETLHVPTLSAVPLRDVTMLNDGHDLRLEKLSVYQWDGTLPSASRDKPLIVRREGDAVAANHVRSFDPATQTLKFNDDTTIPLDQIGRVFWNDDASSSPTEQRPTEQRMSQRDVPTANVPIPEPPIEVRFHDGSRVFGEWLEVDQESIVHFQVHGLEHLHKFHLNRVAAIVGSPERLPETFVQRGSATMQSASLTLLGAIVKAPQLQSESVLWWKSPGLLRPARIQLNTSAAIAFPGAERDSASIRTAAKAALQPGSETEQATTMRTRNLTFRTGDSIDGTIERIDSRGVLFHSEVTSCTFARHDQMQSVVLVRRLALPRVDPVKLQRMLTVPRMNKSDPPTQVVIAKNGDCLRGRLIQMDEDWLVMEIRAVESKIPRNSIAQIVWLHERDWNSEGSVENEHAPPPPQNTESQLVHAVSKKGGGLTFRPHHLHSGTNELEGTSTLLGECKVPISQLSALLIGADAPHQALHRQAEVWKLSLAANPLALNNNKGSAALHSDSTVSPLVGRPAHDFKLRDLDGEEWRMDKQRGRVIVLDFWASWCEPCRKLLPELHRAVSSLERDDVELLAVNLQEAPEQTRRFSQDWKIGSRILLDSDGAVADAYRTDSIPRTLIIDRDGIVRHVFEGNDGNVLERIVRALEATIGDPPP